MMPFTSPLKSPCHCTYCVPLFHVLSLLLGNIKRCWNLKTFNTSLFNILTLCTHCLYPHIYFSCSLHKQLNGDLKGITFVMLAVQEKVALFLEQTRLLLYAHEQFAISLHLLHSSYIMYIYIFYIYIWLYDLFYQKQY